jgi:hypothetical protein
MYLRRSQNPEKGRSHNMLECVTIKPGTPCNFMRKTGCGFDGGACRPIIEACEGCGYTTEYENGTYCQLYADPAMKWSLGRCNFATHIKADFQPSAQRLNPLKASKRSMRQQR